jgi:hypothetical protein
MVGVRAYTHCVAPGMASPILHTAWLDNPTLTLENVIIAYFPKSQVQKHFTLQCYKCKS